MIKRPLGIAAFVVVLFTFLYANGVWPGGGYPSRQAMIDETFEEGDEVSICGLVYHKEIKNSKAVYYVKCNSITLKDAQIFDSKVIFVFDSDSIPLFSTITAKGQVQVFEEARNQGNFDEKLYYNSLGLIFRMENSVLLSQKTGFVFQGDLLYNFRKAIAEVYQKALNAEEADLMAAIALGDKSELNSETKELFSGVGLSHLLAISGLHVSVICMSIYNLLKKRGLGFSASAIISSVVALLFCIMSGASISTIRAISMFIIMVTGAAFGLAYDCLTALSVVAAMLVVFEPARVLNTGFIFSFSAVAVVCLVASRCENGILVSLAITFGTMPVVALFYYEIPSYSFVVNLLLLPMLPVMLALALLGGLAGLFFLPFGEGILFIVHLMLYALEFISGFFSKMPYSKIITGRPSVLALAVFEILLVLIVRVLPKLSKNRLLQVMLMFGLVPLLFLHPKNFEIDVLDVGQGDAIFVTDKDGSAFFFDGGSTSVGKVGKYRILPFLKYKGVRSIDYWLVSHPDEDHVSGFKEIMEEGYPVRNLVLAEAQENISQTKELAEFATAHGCNVIYMNQGEGLKTDTLSMECVYPGSGRKGEDMNELCLAIKLTVDENKDGKVDFAGLFLGDLGITQEEYITAHNLLELKDYGPGNNYDYLKVAHHGSKNSSSEKLLREISPTIATISCARKNSYGHPSKEAMERIQNQGTDIYCTMELGQITITLDSVSCQIKGE